MTAKSTVTVARIFQCLHFRLTEIMPALFANDKSKIFRKELSNNRIQFVYSRNYRLRIWKGEMIITISEEIELSNHLLELISSIENGVVVLHQKKVKIWLVSSVRSSLKRHKRLLICLPSFSFTAICRCHRRRNKWE